MVDHTEPDSVQLHGLQPLLAWGLLSSAAGLLLLLRRPRGYWFHFGLQALSWGVIDALLAVNGQRQARQRLAAVRAGTRSRSDAARDLQQLQRVLLVNAGLDVLYLLSGRWTARRWHDRDDRRGLGDGIALQGLFLLVYDVWFAAAIARRGEENHD
jgi:hypothetical protein